MHQSPKNIVWEFIPFSFAPLAHVSWIHDPQFGWLEFCYFSRNALTPSGAA